MAWTIPSSEIIGGQTFIKDTDNKIMNIIEDIEDYINGTGDYVGSGISNTFTQKNVNEVISGVYQFSNGLRGNVSDYTGVKVVDVENKEFIGNSSTTTQLKTPRTISLSGDVSGSLSFNGTANVDMVTTIADDSHIHDGRYYTESEIDTKVNTINASLSTLSTTKQDNIVSGTHIKTINNISVVGSGNRQLGLLEILNNTQVSAGTLISTDTYSVYTTSKNTFFSSQTRTFYGAINSTLRLNYTLKASEYSFGDDYTYVGTAYLDILVNGVVVFSTSTTSYLSSFTDIAVSNNYTIGIRIKTTEKNSAVGTFTLGVSNQYMTLCIV